MSRFTTVFFLAFLALLAVSTTAFSTMSSSRPFGAIRPTNTARFMFSADEKPKVANDESAASAASPLSEVSAAEASSIDPAVSVLASTSSEASTDENEIKAVYRDMNTGKEKEVKWVDPAMAANTNLLDNLSFGYFFLVFPATLLLNDAFHFLPTEGPFAFLSGFK
jgi:hypothetical protein